MQYQVTKEKSAEYLRLAVHHMTQQEAAFHPVSYAVWYEYASGEHARLIEEVNLLIEKKKNSLKNLPPASLASILPASMKLARKRL